MVGHTPVKHFGRLRFWSQQTSTVTTKVGAGELILQAAGKRKGQVMRSVSAGTGDDAGHLIAKQFGGPDDVCNLGRQNWIQNQSKGTYRQQELRWVDALSSGARVFVIVQEHTLIKNPDRPFCRKVDWKIRNANGSVDRGELLFSNNDSEKVRKALGLPAAALDIPDNVIHVDFSQRSK